MCGRFAIYNPVTKGSVSLLEHDVPANFNAAPTAQVPMIRIDEKTNEQALFIARWGLIPKWAKDLKIPPFFNARADKLSGNKCFGLPSTNAVWFQWPGCMSGPSRISNRTISMSINNLCSMLPGFTTGGNHRQANV